MNFEQRINFHVNAARITSAIDKVVGEYLEAQQGIDSIPTTSSN